MLYIACVCDFHIAGEGVLKKIVKFDGNNFQLWKFQILAVFDVYVIRDVVTDVQAVFASIQAVFASISDSGHYTLILF